MKNYFVPKINELSDGYYFEYQFYNEELNEYEDKWIETVFDSRDGLGNDLTHQFFEETVRCEFLTKEQIEAEGWQKLITHDLLKCEAFSKNDFELSYFYKEKLLKIIKKEKIKTVILYQGSCKCINEFKKIIKLIKNE